MKADPYLIVRRPILTEKGQQQTEESNTYPFEVDRKANKIEIKGAIEKIYAVSVKSVRTVRMPGKRRRAKAAYITTPVWKKAYVTLAEGDVIDIL